MEPFSLVSGATIEAMGLIRIASDAILQPLLSPAPDFGMLWSISAQTCFTATWQPHAGFAPSQLPLAKLYAAGKQQSSAAEDVCRSQNQRRTQVLRHWRLTINFSKLRPHSETNTPVRNLCMYLAAVIEQSQDNNSFSLPVPCRCV